MAVKIRMKMMGRKHRPFYRICAVDARNPRDGRVIEELGTYDPMVPDTNARVVLDGERVSYWLGVGAQPTEKVAVLIKKFGSGGTHVALQQAAREKLALPKVVPPAGEPKVALKPPAAEAPADEAPAAEAPAEAPAEEAPPETSE